MNAESQDGHWPSPAARSYDGEPWEPLYPQVGQSRVAVSCDASTCNLTLPPETPGGFGYRVESYNSSTEGQQNLSQSQLRRKKAAKFLIQSTFGPKSDELSAMAAKLDNGTDSRVFGDWVSEQIAMPMTSHRGYFRERLNSRAHAGRLACEPMSRWHRYSFTTLDVAARVNITVSSGTSGVSLMHCIVCLLFAIVQ